MEFCLSILKFINSHTTCILHPGNVHWMDALLSGKQHSSDSYHDILDLIIFASTGLVILVSQVDSQILLFFVCDKHRSKTLLKPCFRQSLLENPIKL